MNSFCNTVFVIVMQIKLVVVAVVVNSVDKPNIQKFASLLFRFPRTNVCRFVSS